MRFLDDCFDAGNVVAASLTQGCLVGLPPEVRRFLCGKQLYVKQADGSWLPKGCQLGLPRHFEFNELEAPARRLAG